MHLCIIVRMPNRDRLASFMDRVRATTRDVATAAKIDQATVVRVKNGASCRAETAAGILRWADAIAERKRIPKRDRLRLDDLVGTAA